MAVIHIEDLSPVEDLTPEEIERIFGAGRKPYQLQLEALEARDLMDAGLVHALQALVPHSASGGAAEAGHVRTLENVYQPIGTSSSTALGASGATTQRQGPIASLDSIFGQGAALDQMFGQAIGPGASLGQRSHTAALVGSGYSPSPQAEANAAGRTLVDNLNHAFAGRRLPGLEDGRIDGFQFQSAQLDAEEESFTVTVNVSLNGGKDHQTLTFSYKQLSYDANKFVSGDIVQSEKGFQFKGETLVSFREQTKFLFANLDPARKAGQTLKDALNDAWAGKQLQGQTIDSFRLVSAEGTELTGFQVTLDVSLNGGKDHQILNFKLTPLRERDVYSVSDPTQLLVGGFQFSRESLATLHAGLRDLPVHFESAQGFGS